MTPGRRNLVGSSCLSGDLGHHINYSQHQAVLFTVSSFSPKPGRLVPSAEICRGILTSSYYRPCPSVGRLHLLQRLLHRKADSASIYGPIIRRLFLGPSVNLRVALGPVPRA